MDVKAAIMPKGHVRFTLVLMIINQGKFACYNIQNFVKNKFK